MRSYIYYSLFLALIPINLHAYGTVDFQDSYPEDPTSICLISQVPIEGEENASYLTRNNSAVCLPHDKQTTYRILDSVDVLSHVISIPAHIYKAGSKIAILSSDKRSSLCSGSNLGRLLNKFNLSQYFKSAGLARNSLFLAVYVYTGVEHIFYLLPSHTSTHRPGIMAALAVSARVLDCQCVSNIFNLHNFMVIATAYSFWHQIGLP
ncbi:hypothetical protein ACH42_02160 [Endozoicomonas sp. (ex Bugula neritina AB1)]|nr:hypothetical protein ACH42_02160 [Endozoicomonas sp. (ex Bugula neritina AB1)]